MLNLESKRKEYEILENDLKATKSSYSTTKFVFIEKISKEICLNTLINNTPIVELPLDINRSTLKKVSNQNKELKLQLNNLCQDFILHQDTIKHNLSVLEQEKEENRRLKHELDLLREEESNLAEQEKENEIVMRNLAQMEEKINEIEKIGCVSEDELNELTNEIGNKSMMLKNYKNEVEENTSNIGRQERYILYKKGMEFIESITGTKVLECIVIENGVKVMIETVKNKFWIYLINNKLCEVRKVNTDGIESDIFKEAVQFAVKEDDPVFLFKFMMQE